MKESSKYMNSKTEKELIKNCIRNKRDAQKALYQKYYSSMMSVCIRYMKDEDMVKEILNKSFLQVFLKLKEYKGKGSIEGWIKRIVINTSLNKLKSEKTKVQHIENYSISIDNKVDNDGLNKLITADILKIIHELPPMSKKVFNLFVMDG